MWVITGMLVCLILLLFAVTWSFFDTVSQNKRLWWRIIEHNARLKNLEGAVHKHAKSQMARH